MNIGFCKIGKSIKFKGAYSPIGGDNEAPNLLRILANNNPDKTFVLIGKSDFHKLSESERLELFPFDNVVNIMKEYRKDDRDYISMKLKDRDIVLDSIVMMVGQVGTVTVPGKIKQIKNPDLIASVIDMTLGYTTPIVEFINDHQEIPIIEIINDPRYTLAQARDIIPNPKVSLSQYDYSYIKNSINSYEDQTRTEHSIPAKYAHVEKIFLYGRGAPEKNPRPEVDFMIVLNEGSPSRYDMLKTWVLNNIEDVEIYGKWDHKETQSDRRFVGSLNIEELQRKLSNVRATFIIPIADGWVTSKYIEMIHAGVVPFLHPSYDKQNHLDLPDFFRPSTPSELMKRVEMLKDDDFFMKAITALQSKFCMDEYYNGSALNEIIMSEIIDGYVAPDVSQYAVKESNTLDSLFG